MTFSVIIPALNEAERLGATLDSIAAQGETDLEVLVVDGGSTDATAALAIRGGARVLTSPPGRARQMNAGAAAATGDVLLFLHADTLLPPDGLARIREALTRHEAEAGAFRLAFDRWTPLLRFYSACTRLHRPGLCFGDRALFVRRNVFEAIGGYAPLPIFEDLDIVRRLYRRGRFRFLSAYVTTAARRFERQGPLRQQVLNSYLWCSYMLGRSPERLHHRYSYAPDERG